MIYGTLNPGDQVYSKRLYPVGGFDGVIVEKRGNGYQVLNPKTGNVYQRDDYDLILLKKSEIH